MAGRSVRYGKLCEKRLLHMMTGPVLDDLMEMPLSVFSLTEKLIRAGSVKWSDTSSSAPSKT